MTAFFWGVVSSLVASVLFVGAGWFSSARLRGLLIALLARLTGTGLQRVYATQAQANVELGPELIRARWVKVFASRGNELTRNSFQAVWSDALPRLESVQILLPDPAAVGHDSWLARRERETARHDRGFGNGLLPEQIRSNVRYLEAQARKRQGVELRLYDFPHLCRIIATDQVAYLTTYTDHEHGRNSQCLVFARSSGMYDFVLRLFAAAWTEARPADAATSQDQKVAS